MEGIKHNIEGQISKGRILEPISYEKKRYFQVVSTAHVP